MRSFYVLLILIMVILGGCKSNAVQPEVKDSSSASQVADELDSLAAIDTAIVLEVDLEDKSVILQSADSGRRYEVSYDGLSYFYNEYGELITADFLDVGDIAQVSVSVHSAYLSQFTLLKNVFKVSQSSNYTINKNKKLFTVNNENFKLSDRLVVILNGALADISDINEEDVITVTGIDRTALVCFVENGNGLLRLKGEEPFIGGWVEIGNIIKPIEEKMEFSVPEGEYELRISYHGRSEVKPVRILRGETTKVDISDLKDSIIQSGMVTFSIAPSDAKLFINGEETDYLLPVELEYGVYRMTVTSRGYETVNRYISVHKDALDIEVTLSVEGTNDEENEDEGGKGRESSASSKEGNIDYVVPGKKDLAVENAGSSSTGNTNLDSSSMGSFDSDSSQESDSSSSIVADAENNAAEPSGNESSGLIYIEKPKKTEVYFDGDYKGITPISFKKVPGSHVITLRRDGYKTKSYTVNIEDNDEDQTYEFGKLMEEDE